MSQEDDHQSVEEHILTRFDLQEFKGKGAYGIVWKAYDKKSKQVVALKKVFDAFQNSTDAQRTYREVVFLKQLNHHDNIIKLISVIRADNNKDLYMVFEYMETDLHRVIRADLLNSMHQQYIIYQLMKCLKYIHSGLLVHRDLKPANLLVNASCQLKVADFGLARCVSSAENNEENPIMTEYVATRWYRAPEILYGSHEYSTAVDMWSAGCILGEMLLSRAMFAGTSTLDQIDQIVSLLGKPTSEDLESISAPMASTILQQISSTKKYTFKQFFPKGTDVQLDFLKKLMAYNPTKRMSAEEALDHPYLKDFKGSEPENSIQEYISIPLNDNKKLRMQDYRDALYQGLINKKRQKIQDLTEQQKKVENSRGDETVKPVFFKSQAQVVRSKSRMDQRSESVGKKISQPQYFNKQDLLKVYRTSDKAKSFNLESEEIPTAHKYMTTKPTEIQVPATSHNKQQATSYQLYKRNAVLSNYIKPDSQSRDNSRTASAEGTLTQQLIAQAQYNYNNKKLSQKKDLLKQFQCSGYVDKRDSKTSIKKSKTPDLRHYQMQHSRSLSQNKNIPVSRSSSKPKNRGSPYHTDAKQLLSQPDIPQLSKSIYNFSSHLNQYQNAPLYAKILSKHQTMIKATYQNLSKYAQQYESLKK